ncbi:MAG: NAD(P)-dependent oxidoreductase [Proteobacteria bacterium]|nr:NAD(P)-dependent oxidoreductase [Pseudomonadota bacterium]
MAYSQTTTLGFIGLGSMGSPMAGNIIKSGLQIHIFDIDASRCAALSGDNVHTCSSSIDVANQADIVFTCLPSLDAARSVVLDPTKGVLKGSRIKSIVSLGTTGSAYAKDAAFQLQAHNIAFLDSPISGGPAGAKDATLAVMCSGDRVTYEFLCADVFPHMSAKQFYVGDKPGMAQVMKLVNNINLFIHLAGTLESLTLGEKAGLNPTQMIDVINASSGLSRSSQVFIPNNILSGRFNFGASNSILKKDLELWAAEVKMYESSDQVGKATQSVFDQAIHEHGADADITTIYKTLKRIASLK